MEQYRKKCEEALALDMFWLWSGNATGKNIHGAINAGKSNIAALAANEMGHLQVYSGLHTMRIEQKLG